jgi:hypothetical protein
VSAEVRAVLDAAVKRGDDWYRAATVARADVERLRAALRALIDATPGSHPLYEASLAALHAASTADFEGPGKLAMSDAQATVDQAQKGGRP